MNDTMNHDPIQALSSLGWPTKIALALATLTLLGASLMASLIMAGAAMLAWLAMALSGKWIMSREQAADAQEAKKDEDVVTLKE